ncbi:MAG: DUF47 family protein [Candidatus Omnitrophica bacterium]|nr:DUF47 family protein [Candidatus Omnitrophota bacterium]
MKERRNILGWIGLAEEQVIMEDARKHIEETCKTVAFFDEAIKAFIADDNLAKATAIANVRESEHRADILRSKMVSALSEGLLLPPDREELLHFVKNLDRICDWTNGAARILDFISVKLPAEVLSNMSIASDLITNSTNSLKEAVDAILKNDLKLTLEKCEEVDRLEHEADDRKKNFIEAALRAKLEPIPFFLCYQIAEYMEGVTDTIEDAADFVKVLAIKSK